MSRGNLFKIGNNSFPRELPGPPSGSPRTVISLRGAACEPPGTPVGLLYGFCNFLYRKSGQSAAYMQRIEGGCPHGNGKLFTYPLTPLRGRLEAKGGLRPPPGDGPFKRVSFVLVPLSLFPVMTRIGCECRGIEPLRNGGFTHLVR